MKKQEENSRNPVLKRAFTELAQKEYARYADTPSVQPSEQFDRKMQALLRAQRSPRQKCKRLAFKCASVLAVLVLLGGGIAFSSPAVQAQIVTLFKHVHKAGTDLIFNPDPTKPSTLKTTYLPAALPEGFVENTRFVDDNDINLYWSHPNGDAIFYNQFCFSNSTYSIDTENCTEQAVLVNGAAGTLYQKAGYKALIWQTDEYFFSLFYEGNAPYDLLAIAESLVAVP